MAKVNDGKVLPKAALSKTILVLHIKLIECNKLKVMPKHFMKTSVEVPSPQSSFVRVHGWHILSSILGRRWSQNFDRHIISCDYFISIVVYIMTHKCIPTTEGCREGTPTMVKSTGKYLTSITLSYAPELLPISELFFYVILFKNPNMITFVFELLVNNY